MTKPELEVLNEKLKAELEHVRKLNNEQDVELAALRAGADNVQKLKNEYTERLSEAYWMPTKNERGAGRKPKISPELIHEVNCLRVDGLSQRAIAEKLSISVGLVNKACNALI